MKKDNSDELVKKLTEMIDIIKKDDEPEKVELSPVEKTTVSKCPMSGCPLKDCKKGMCVIRFDIDQEEDDLVDFNVESDSVMSSNQMDSKKSQQDWVSYTVKSFILSSVILMLFIMIFVNIFKIIRTSSL